ncbi:MAG: AMP-binding protein [Bacteroidales bacterium]|nr:AMP-binding protein [Bacteroidales bacterium]
MLKENFINYLEQGILNNWEFNALSDYKGETFTYAEIAGHINYFHQLFEKTGIKNGDKIALIGKNSARWCMLYLAVVSYGAVIVPILPDFKSDDLHEIVNHSDAVLLFAGGMISGRLDASKMPNLTGILAIDDFSIMHTYSSQLKDAHSLNELAESVDAIKQNKKAFSLAYVSNANLAVISYTSGTTGFTKGVMIPHNSLAANVRFAQRNMPLKAGDKIVSFLPLAHAFGAAFEFLFPFSVGCHITILTKTPSPQIIIKAFEEIKPALILSVPLVIEKIYKNKLLPVLRKWHINLLLSLPVINKILFKKFKAKLSDVFGNNFQEIIIGGAPLNKEAEAFFRKMNFHFTVGYGMTECGPLISYEKWTKFVLGSSGKVVDTLEIKIDSTDPENIPGEIMVRGENVMLGYYKNEKATKEILEEDGWLHTGDLGLIDKEGNIHIKGRSKSMILGANGKNIYPEEIEAIFDNRFAVGESLIVHRNDKLVALIYPDFETVEKENITPEELLKLYEHHKKAINQKLPGYMNVAMVEIQHEEFIKTPKKNIKRFLYN